MITKRNYDRVLEEAQIENLRLSESLLRIIDESIYGQVHFVSVGNSISAGYSKCDIIKPFLKRSAIYQLGGSNYEYYSYARVRRNEDSNILTWYNKDFTNETMATLNVNDILAKKGKYVEAKWDDSIIDEYFNLSNGKVIGLKTLNGLGNNIIIYNGMTGIFTNIWRNGELRDRKRILSAFKEDLGSFDAFLRQVYIDNPNTQVYVCGLPNIQGTGIISVLDKFIIKICSKYPNVVFVPGTIRNAFHRLEGQQEFDVHYSSPEYTILWNQITEAMITNFKSTQLKSSLLSRLQQYSLETEKRSTISTGNVAATDLIIDNEVERYFYSHYANRDIQLVIQEIMKYYDNRYLTLFPCTPRESVLEKLQSVSDNVGHSKNIGLSPIERASQIGK